jgi:hypothetical protein
MSAVLSNRLPVLAESIRGAEATIKRTAAEMAEAIIQAGTHLIEARELLPHGRFGKWLKDNCGVSERSAQRYMTVARSGFKSDTVADLGLRGTLAAIDRGAFDHGVAGLSYFGPGEQLIIEADDLEEKYFARSAVVRHDGADRYHVRVTSLPKVHSVETAYVERTRHPVPRGLWLSETIKRSMGTEEYTSRIVDMDNMLAALIWEEANFEEPWMKQLREQRAADKAGHNQFPGAA